MKSIALAAAASLALLVSACGPRQSPQERVQAHADKVLAKIEANDNQKLVVKTALDEFAVTMKEQREVRKSSRSVFQAQLAAKSADEAALNAEADKIAKSFSETAHAFVDAGATIHATLTPAQREKLTAEMKPGRGMRAAFFLAGRMGYGPPADKTEATERMEENFEEALDRIDATEAQRKALRPLALGLVDEALPLLERKDVVSAAFIDAWKSDKPDVAALHSLVDSETVRINALLRSATSRMAAAHKVLTPEQRTQIAANMANGGGCDGHDDDGDSDADAPAAVKN